MYHFQSVVRVFLVDVIKQISVCQTKLAAVRTGERLLMYATALLASEIHL